MSDILSELFSLKGKTALVTGGGGAIGRVLAHGLASAGARVAMPLRPRKDTWHRRYNLPNLSGCSLPL